MPDALSALIRLFSLQWNGVPVASLLVFAIGGLMYAAMSMSTRSSLVDGDGCAPAWLDRSTSRSRWHPTNEARRSHRLCLGDAPGRAESARAGPRRLDPGSAGLWENLRRGGSHRSDCVAGQRVRHPGPETVTCTRRGGRRRGGTIWTIGGDRRWDALPADPSELANQLVEVLPVDARTKVYRDAARLWVLVAGQALQRQRELPTVDRLAALCRPGGLATLLKAQGSHMAELPRLSQTEQDGVLSLGTSLSVLGRGVAGRSLGAGAGALRLEDAMTAGKIVLLQMVAGPYPEETRMLGAWALRSMLRLLRLPAPCVLVCDEFARLGVQGWAALDLLALGREFGKPVILCTQGPSDFGELGGACAGPGGAGCGVGAGVQARYA